LTRAEIIRFMSSQPRYCWYSKGKTYHDYSEKRRGPRCETKSVHVLNISDSISLRLRPCSKCFYKRKRTMHRQEVMKLG